MKKEIAEIEALYAKYDALFGTTPSESFARRILTHSDLTLLASIENLLTYEAAYSILVPVLNDVVAEANLATSKSAL
jgi:hypothetical protein